MEYSGRAFPPIWQETKRLRREKGKRLKRDRAWEKRWGEGNLPEGLAGVDGKTQRVGKRANKEKGSGKNSGAKGISWAAPIVGAVRATSKGSIAYTLNLICRISPSLTR
jgi:hypothetical protein